MDLEFISDFIKSMRRYECSPANESDISDTNGQWRRYQLYGDPKGKTVGYYRLKIDSDFAVGNFGSRRTGETHTWTCKSKTEWTEEEKQAWKEKIDAEKRQAEKEQQEAWESARIKATQRWNAASPAPEDHPYLLKKKITGDGLRIEGSNLIVPAYGLDGNKVILWNIQEIAPDGQKKWQFGAKKKGTFFPIMAKDDRKDTIIICEGYATGRSIYTATGYPVLVAWDTGNLIEAGRAAKKRYPDAKFIFACDNDQFTKGNPGLTKGRWCAEKLNGFYAFPEFSDQTSKPTDFNDAFILLGADYVKKTIEAAIQKEQPEPPSAPATAEINIDWMELARWKNRAHGVYDKNYSVHNANIILTHAPYMGGHIVYDEFCKREVVVKPLPWDEPENFQIRKVSNRDIIQVRAWLELREIRLNKAATHDALKVAASNHTINPAREYLSSLVWDKKPRLDNWLTYYLGAEKQPIEYLQKISSCWLIAAAKRIYEPGTAFHHMLVLEGGQAAGKSSALRSLATFGRDTPIAYFSDRVTFDHVDKKDFAEFASGCVILEFQELSGLGKKDRNKVKQWITQDSDEYRAPYESVTTVYPRQFVLAGTTNDTQYLTDPTGDRRFWPATVGEHIDNDALKRDREQLWAEAVYRYKSGELWFIPKEDPVYKFMENEQSARYVGDPWETVICDAIELKQKITVDEIFSEVLRIPKERWDKNARFRIADVLTKAGWENKVIYNSYDKKAKRMWVKKDKTGTQDELID